MAAPTGLRVSALITVLEKGSTRSLCAAKKSTPRIGLVTAARIKVHKNEAAPKTNLFDTFPQEAMPLPSAPTRAGPDDASPDL